MSDSSSLTDACDILWILFRKIKEIKASPSRLNCFDARRFFAGLTLCCWVIVCLEVHNEVDFILVPVLCLPSIGTEDYLGLGFDRTDKYSCQSASVIFAWSLLSHVPRVAIHCDGDPVTNDHPCILSPLPWHSTSHGLYPWWAVFGPSCDPWLFRDLTPQAPLYWCQLAPETESQKRKA